MFGKSLDSSMVQSRQLPTQPLRVTPVPIGKTRVVLNEILRNNSAKIRPLCKSACYFRQVSGLREEERDHINNDALDFKPIDRAISAACPKTARKRKGCLDSIRLKAK
jgi:hypothetical protein